MKRKFRTHYDNLKISEDAPIEVIKSAYRALALKHHPDRSDDKLESERIMKIINDSYSVLSDPTKRARHDKWILEKSKENDLSKFNFPNTYILAEVKEIKTTQTHSKNSRLKSLIETRDVHDVFVKEKITFLQIFMLMISVIFLVVLYLNFDEKWDSDSLIIISIFSIFATIAFFKNGGLIIGYVSSVLKPGLFFHEDFLLRIRPFKIYYWPIGKIQYFRRDDEVWNGEFLSTTFVFTVSGKDHSFTTADRQNADIFEVLFKRCLANKILSKNEDAYVLERNSPDKIIGVDRPWPGKAVFSTIKYFLLGVYPLVIVFFFMYNINFSKERLTENQKTSTPEQVETTQKAVSLDPLGKPWPLYSNYIDGYEKLNSDGRSTVTIDNSKNDSDIYLKLVYHNTNDEKTVRHCFIKLGGKFVIVDLKPGFYSIKYQVISTGEVFKSEGFDLRETKTREGVKFSEVSLTLFKVRDGNFNTKRISPDEF